MALHPNAQLIQDYLASVERYIESQKNGTAPSTGYENKYISDDIVAHYTGRSDVGGWHDADAFFNRIAPRLSQYEASIVEVIDILASDDRACLIVKERLEAADGRSIEFVRVAIYRIVNGLITEMWVRDEDPHAMDEFLMAGPAKVPA